jgi:acetoin utilization protein AcuC
MASQLVTGNGCRGSNRPGQDDDLKTQIIEAGGPLGAGRELCIPPPVRQTPSPSIPSSGAIVIMSDRKLAFLYSPEVEGLSYPPDCPFKTQRAGLTRLRLKSFGLLDDANRFEAAPRRATLDDLKSFHTPEYLDALQRANAGDLTVDALRMGIGSADTPVFKDMFEYSAWAAGAALTAAGLLLERKADVAFNLLGGFHHAHPGRASGFCYLNDVALACQKLAGAGKRVLYLDLDAHHGDGVQAGFFQRKDVMTVSLHETGKALFPWGGFENEIGEGPGRGFNVNVPLPPETYDEAFLTAFDSVVAPLAAAFQPEALVVELGMDILAGDPLSHLRMTNNVIVEVIGRLLKWNCPILVAGGGGYDIENTVRGWALAWRTFCEETDESDFTVGMGGIMLSRPAPAHGLRDNLLPVSLEQRRAVEPELRATMDAVINSVFQLHGLQSPSGRVAGPAILTTPLTAAKPEKSVL